MIEEILKSCPTFRGVCPNPVFIIGSPRSGTTALAASLAQHSQLWTAPESDFLFHLFARQHAAEAYRQSAEVSGDRWLKAESVGRDEFLSYVGLGLNALYSSRSGGKRWVEQTPLYTLICEGLSELFPGACFIHILRDGRKVVNSMMNFLKSDGVKSGNIGGEFVGSWTTDFREACRIWNQYAQFAMRFQERHPDRCITVRNEQLLRDPRHGFGAIFNSIGAPYEDGPPVFFASHRINSSFQNNSVEQLSAVQFPNPWKNWTTEQRLIFLGEAGATMLQCGLATEGEFWLTKKGEYPALVARVAHVVEETLPGDGRVAVVSRGDEDFLKLGGRKTTHFPCTADGQYAGHHPADSDEAIRQLESLRTDGLEYLLFPATSLWWLDHYPEFQKYLNETSRGVLVRDEACLIYAFVEPPTRSLDTAVAGNRGQ